MSEQAPDLPLAPEVFLGRQPIIDRQQQLFAYELLFRNGQKNWAEVTNAVQATATVIANVFSELSLGDTLGQHRGFINVDAEMLFADLLEVLPTEQVVLELLETIELTPAVVARCQELRQKGFQLALDDVLQLNDSYTPILPIIDYVKVDLKETDVAALPEMIARIHAQGKRALAEKIDTREEVKLCFDLGFDLFQGYYFARPVIIRGKKLNSSQLTLLRLIELLQSDADTAKLEDVLKQAPALTLNLLRLTNSVACGLSVKVTSLRHAITVLGRRQLQRWLQLLLYTADDGAGFSPLLMLAATRARCMELLAPKALPALRGAADDAFMTGILSLTPTLLGVPIEEVTSGLGLATAVETALLTRKGELGDLLSLVEVLENGDLTATAYLLSRLPGIDANDLNRSLAQALAWTESIGREAA